jgi:uncharacterized protein DUF4157
MKAVQTKPATTTAKKNTPFFNKEASQDFFSHGKKDNDAFFKTKNTTHPIQAKLNIGKPDDHYEKEADATADKVVQRLSEPAGIQKKSIAPVSPITPLIQNKCSHCEQEEKLQKKDKEEDTDLVKNKLQRKPIFESNAELSKDGIQRKCAACEKEDQLQKKGNEDDKDTMKDPLQKKAIFESNEESPQILQKKSGLSSASEGASPKVESSLAASKGSGSPLPQQTRQQMESSFGTDFSGVRIHDNSTAAEMNKELHAQAFTHGSDVYFSSGKYNTSSTAGQHLLAHELTHVVQQKSDSVQRKAIPQNVAKTNAVKPVVAQPLPENKLLKKEVEEKSLHNEKLQRKPIFEGNAEPPEDENTVQTKRENFNAINKTNNEIIQRANIPADDIIKIKDATDDDLKDKKNTKGKYQGILNKANGGKIDIHLEKLLAKEYLKKDDVKFLTASSIQLPKASEERKTKQIQKWKTAVREDVTTKLEDVYKTDKPEKNLSLTLKSRKETGIIGTFRQLVEEVLIPFWNKSGKPQLYDVEHKVDYQIAGNDKADNPLNLILLDRTYNRSLGNIVKDNIHKHIEGLILYYSKFFSGLNKDADYNLAKNAVFVELDKLNFTEKKLKGDDSYEQESITKTKNPYKKEFIEIRDAKIPPNQFLLKTAEARAGYLLPFNTTKTIGAWKISSEFDKNEQLQSLFFEIVINDSGRTIETGSKKPERKKIQFEKEEDFIYKVTGRDLKVQFGAALKELYIKKLSPIEFGDINVDGFDVSVSGKVTPTLSFLKGADISFSLDNGDFIIEADIPLTSLAKNFPKPFNIDSAVLVISANSSEGLSVAGDIGFSLGKFGEGNLSAGVDKTGVFLDGKFNFTNKWFKPAEINFSYRKGDWSIGGEIGILPKTIPGVKEGHLKITYAKDQFAASGEAKLSVPGLDKIILSAQFDDKGNFAFAAEVALGKLPGIKSGNVKVGITSKEGQEDIKLNVVGNAVPDFPKVPGLEGELNVLYDDGVFDMNAKVAYKKGRFEGIIEVGVTNKVVDEKGKPQGQPQEGVGEKGDVTIYGFGQLTVVLFKDSKGTVSVRLTPDKDVLVAGEILLQNLSPFGEGYNYDKEILPFPKIKIPLAGVPGLSISAFIDGGVHFKFNWQPLILKELRVGFKETDIHEIENATIEIHGKVGSSASAEVYIAINAGLEAQALIAKLSGKIGGQAGLGIEAEAGGDLDASWNTEKGLLFKEIRAFLNVTPKAVFRLTGNVSVDLDLWVTTINLYSHDWVFAEKQLDLGALTLKLDFPIRFDDQGKVIEPKYEQMNIEKPNFTGDQGKDILDKAINGDAEKELEAKKQELREKIRKDLLNSTNDEDFTPSKYREKMSEKYEDNPELKVFVLKTIEEESRNLEYEQFGRFKNHLRTIISPLPNKLSMTNIFVMFHAYITPEDVQAFTAELMRIEEDKKQKEAQALNDPKKDGNNIPAANAGVVNPIQTKRDRKEEDIAQTKQTSSSEITASPNIESSINASKGEGSSLPAQTRQQMESSFGTDFSGVRIHGDSASAAMNKKLNAQAFTHGSHIHFNSGKYDASSTAGKHLLAHGLTHTVQQDNSLKRNSINENKSQTRDKTESQLNAAKEKNKKEKTLDSNKKNDKLTGKESRKTDKKDQSSKAKLKKPKKISTNNPKAKIHLEKNNKKTAHDLKINSFQNKIPKQSIEKFPGLEALFGPMQGVPKNINDFSSNKHSAPIKKEASVIMKKPQDNAQSTTDTTATQTEKIQIQELTNRISVSSILQQQRNEKEAESMKSELAADVNLLRNNVENNFAAKNVSIKTLFEVKKQFVSGYAGHSKTILDGVTLTHEQDATQKSEKPKEDLLNGLEETKTEIHSLAGQKTEEALKVKPEEENHVKTKIHEQAEEARNKGRQKTSLYSDDEKGNKQKDAVIQVANKAAQEIEGKEPEILEAISDITEKIPDAFNEQADDVIDKLSDGVDQFSSSIEDIAQNTVHSMDDSKNEAYNEIDSADKEAIEHLNQSEDATLQEIQANLPQLEQQLTDLLDKTNAEIDESKNSANQQLQQITSDAIAHLSMATEEQAAENFTEQAIAYLTQIGDSSIQWFQASEKSLSDNLSETGVSIKNGLDAAEAKISGGIETFSTTFASSIDKFVATYTGILDEQIQSEQDAFNQVKEKALAQLKNAKDSLAKGYDSSIEKIKVDLNAKVSEGLSKNDEALSQLDSKMAQAASDAAWDFDHPVLSFLRDAALFVAGIIAALALIILIIVGFEIILSIIAVVAEALEIAAAVVQAFVLIAGIGLLLYSIYKDYKKRISKGEGSGLATLGMAILDTVGLTDIYRVFKDKNLSPFERGALLAEGLFKLVTTLLLIRGAWKFVDEGGLAKAWRALRPEEPLGKTPETNTPESKKPEEPDVKPPVKPPTSLEELRLRLSPEAQKGFDQQKELLSLENLEKLAGKKQDGTYDVNIAEQRFKGKLMSDEDFANEIERRNQVLRNNAEKAVKKINNICDENDGTNRPNAVVGNGTTESAITDPSNGEIVSGKPVGATDGHAGKAAQAVKDINANTREINNARKAISDPQKTSEIDATIRRGQERINKLQEALDKWNNRSTSNPSVWNPDGTSKVTPDFPKNPGPL